MATFTIFRAPVEIIVEVDRGADGLYAATHEVWLANPPSQLLAAYPGAQRFGTEREAYFDAMAEAEGWLLMAQSKQEE